MPLDFKKALALLALTTFLASTSPVALAADEQGTGTANAPIQGETSEPDSALLASQDTPHAQDAPADANSAAPASSAEAREETPPEFFMLGVQLMITVEEIADATTVGINVAPLVIEAALTDLVGLRLWPLFNILFSSRGVERGHLGLGLTVPFYFMGDAPSNRWYVGPIAALAANPVVEGSDLILGAEFGLRWEVAERWSFNVAIQGGVTRLDGVDGVQWVNHFGVFPSIGCWMF